jgi:hypothetical protein
MAIFVFSGAEDPSEGQASHRPAPRPGDAMPAGDETGNREERKGRGKPWGPDGFPVSPVLNS